MTSHPAVSVIINTLDRSTSLERTLTSLRQLRYPNFEVIVIQGPCSDRTHEVLAQFRDRVRIGVCKEANLAMSRNIGLTMAAGKFVAFLDDDAVPEPDWLDHLVDGFSDPNVAVVGGFIRDQDGVNFQYQVVIANRFADVRLSASPDSPKTTDEYLSPTGTNVAFRRDILIEIGGFDEQYAYFLEETDVNLRLHERGCGLVLKSDAEVHHKFLANRVRDPNRKPRSRYLIARSKAYFSWTHARARKSDGEIRAYVESYCAREKWGVRWLSLLGRISRSELRTLIREIDRGVAAGTENALCHQGRRLRLSTDPSNADMGVFLPFASRTAALGRMRICFLTRTDPQDAIDDATLKLYGAALALAERGHEVSLLCPGGSGTCSVDFVAGLWLHRFAIRSHWMFRIGRRSAEWALLGAAAHREIERIQARRRLQAVIAPCEGIAAFPHLAELNVPFAAIRIGEVARNAVDQGTHGFEPRDGRISVIALEGQDRIGTWIEQVEEDIARLIKTGYLEPQRGESTGTL